MTLVLAALFVNVVVVTILPVLMLRAGKARGRIGGSLAGQVTVDPGGESAGGVTLMRAPARGTAAMDAVYGGDTPARRILACVYATIAAASLCAIVLHWALPLSDAPRTIAAVLFPVQIVYKVSTLWAVGWRNPVVKSNLAICVLLAAALAELWSGA
jgi:hypothetical protein